MKYKSYASVAAVMIGLSVFASGCEDREKIAQAEKLRLENEKLRVQLTEQNAVKEAAAKAANTKLQWAKELDLILIAMERVAKTNLTYDSKSSNSVHDRDEEQYKSSALDKKEEILKIINSLKYSGYKDCEILTIATEGFFKNQKERIVNSRIISTSLRDGTYQNQITKECIDELFESKNVTKTCIDAVKKLRDELL